MLKRITWISWLALGLLILGIISAFVILPLITVVPAYKSNINENYYLVFPLALLSSIAFFVFLKKAKSMPMDSKTPWLIFSVASFSFLFYIILNFLSVFVKQTNVDNPISTIIIYINIAVMFMSMVMVFFGFVYEATKDEWKNRKSPMWPLYMLLAFVTVVSMLIGRAWPFSEILTSFGFKLIPVGICLRVVLLAKKEPISLCYKIILAGFIFDLVCSMANVPLKLDFVTSIIMLVNLFCIVVATDIRTQIWLEESSVKALPETEETKC